MSPRRVQASSVWKDVVHYVDTDCGVEVSAPNLDLLNDDSLFNSFVQGRLDYDGEESHFWQFGHDFRIVSECHTRETWDFLPDQICALQHVELDLGIETHVAAQNRLCSKQGEAASDYDPTLHTSNTEIYCGTWEQAMEICENLNVPDEEKTCFGFDMHSSKELFWLNGAPECANDDDFTGHDEYDRWRIVEVQVPFQAKSSHPHGCGPAIPIQGSSYGDRCPEGVGSADVICQKCHSAQAAFLDANPAGDQLLCMRADECRVACGDDSRCHTYAIHSSGYGCLLHTRAASADATSHCAIGDDFVIFVAKEDKQPSDQDYFDVCNWNSDCSTDCHVEISSTATFPTGFLLSSSTADDFNALSNLVLKYDSTITDSRSYTSSSSPWRLTVIVDGVTATAKLSFEGQEFAEAHFATGVIETASDSQNFVVNRIESWTVSGDPDWYVTDSRLFPLSSGASERHCIETESCGTNSYCIVQHSRLVEEINSFQCDVDTLITDSSDTMVNTLASDCPECLMNRIVPKIVSSPNMVISIMDLLNHESGYWQRREFFRDQPLVMRVKLQDLGGGTQRAVAKLVPSSGTSSGGVELRYDVLTVERFEDGCSQSSACVTTELDFHFPHASFSPQFHHGVSGAFSPVNEIQTDVYPREDGWWRVSGCFSATFSIAVTERTPKCPGDCDEDTTDCHAEIGTCMCKFGHKRVNERLCTPVNYECTDQVVTITNAVPLTRGWKIRDVKLFTSKNNCTGDQISVRDISSSESMAYHPATNVIDTHLSSSPDYKSSEFWSSCSDCQPGEVSLTFNIAKESFSTSFECKGVLAKAKLFPSCFSFVRLIVKW